MSDPTWLTELEKRTRDSSSEQVLALCKLVREMAAALKKYEHVPAPELGGAVTQYSAAAEAYAAFEKGPEIG